MFRCLTLVATLVALTHPAHAEDAIAPETVEAIKKATVFVRVEGDGWVASGSGFVVSSDDKGVLIATNHHVAAPTPPTAKPGAKAPTTTVVFDSGTKAERSYTATVAAADIVRDLAVLRVVGVKDPPKPVAYTDPQKPVETMQVYTFGFPFGKALSTNQGFPSITVGKASVSSLRNGLDGELSVIQIDGNLNPGNSGGPVVDSKGRLVGVAVATIRDGQGIGLTIPAAELSRTMQGRVGRVKVTSQKKADGPVTVRIEAPLIDPSGNIRSAVARYVVVAPKAKRPDAASLDGHPGSKPLDLKVEKGVAVGEFTVLAAEGEVLVQVTAGPGGRSDASRVRAFSLAPPADFTGPPPAGWKEYSPRDKTFILWLPEKPARQADEERNMVVSGQRMRVNTVAGKTADGLSYEATSMLLPASFARVARRDLYDLFRGAVVADLKGRVTESKEASSGALAGAEYVVEGSGVTARVRVYVSGARVYLVQVTGAADLVREQDAEMMLSSFRLPGAASVAKGPLVAAPRGKDPVIIAGGGAPPFKDFAADGGLLIGLELGLGKFGREDVTKAVRPIYRVNGKEQLGTQRGSDLSRLVTIKAKEGYAVGAMTHKSGLNFDGCSLTFMKVTADGKLDPKDAYESDWVGYVGTKRPGKLGGDGTPVVGIVGRAGDRDLNGLGLLFKGQEGFDPARPPAAVAGKDKVIGVGKDPFILGSIANDPKFKTLGPDGAILIGVEVRFAKFGGTDIARGVRPIYRVNGKEEFGEQFGKDLSGSVTLKAKDGYAVGGVTGKAGWWCNGFSLTFMKVKPDGTLDPKDSYESEWAGFTGREEVFRVMSDGPPVIGIVGKIVGTETTAFGLLYKGQESFDPKK